MNKTLITLATASLVIAGVVALPRVVDAYQGDPNVQGPNFTEDVHQANLAAFESGDYNAWKENHQGNGRITEIVTEENFARFSEAHRLTLEGDTEGAATIRAELGLGQGMRNGEGQGSGYRGGR